MAIFSNKMLNIRNGLVPLQIKKDGEEEQERRAEDDEWKTGGD